MTKQFVLVLTAMMMVLGGCSTPEQSVFKPLNNYVTSQNLCVSNHEKIQTLLEEEAALFIEIVDLGIENTEAIKPALDQALNKVDKLQTQLESYQACVSKSEDELETINNVSSELTEQTQVELIQNVNRYEESLNSYTQSLSELIGSQKDFYEAVTRGESTKELETLIDVINEQIEEVNEANVTYQEVQATFNAQYEKVFEQIQDEK